MKQGIDKITEMMKYQSSTISIEKDLEFKLLLDHAIFLKFLSQSKKNSIQVAADMQNFAAIIAKRRTELCFVHLLKAQNCFETICWEGMLYAATYIQLLSQRRCERKFTENCIV